MATLWTLVVILHAPQQYVATRAFASEQVCKVIAADLVKRKPELITVCIKQGG